MGNRKEFGVVILAAGRSKRMGYPKMLLPFGQHLPRQSRDQTFLGHLCKIYKDFGCKRPVAVINKYMKGNQYRSYIDKMQTRVQFLLNDNPEAGRFYSIQLALRALPIVSYVFLQDVDTPFITKNTLELLFSGRTPSGFVVPAYRNTTGHPVLLGQKVVQYIKNYPNQNAILRNVLGQFYKKVVQVPDDSILININTQKDYSKYFKK